MGIVLHFSSSAPSTVGWNTEGALGCYRKVVKMIGNAFVRKDGSRGG
jgi:hypothetical protein